MNRTIRLQSIAAVLALVSIASLTNITLAQNTDQVQVNVVVTESSRDRKVNGLAKVIFQIWEDDVAQEILSFTAGSEAGEYVLTFKSTNSAKDGKWRKLRAKLIPPRSLDGTPVTFTVLFKQGYYAPTK